MLRVCIQQQPALCVALLLLAAALTPTAVAIDWQWRTGRATNYGGSGDPWSIHHGSCRYYYLDPTVNKGWDVAALADAASDFQNSCGRCYEVGCAPMHLKDGYGTGLDRSSVCYDTSKTVVVMITDSCPCNYPPNQYSNKRWCCGDYYHFDMSTWAFEKLAERKWGVIGVRYREVPCSYCPENPATLPEGASPEAPAQSAPSGWQPSWDKRPMAQMCFKSSLERQDSNNNGNGNDNTGNSNNNSNNGNGNDNTGNNNNGNSNSQNSGGSTEQQGTSSSSSSSNSSGAWGYSSASASGGTSTQFPSWSLSNSILSNWKDLTAKLNPWEGKGPDGKSAYCGTLDGSATILFKGSTGTMMGKRRLDFDIKTEGGQVPDFSLNLSSTSKGTCRTIDLRGVEGATRTGDWAKLSIPLINLSWQKDWWSSSTDSLFSGCSNSIGAWDVDQIEFKNKWGGRQALCLANVNAY